MVDALAHHDLLYASANGGGGETTLQVPETQAPELQRAAARRPSSTAYARPAHSLGDVRWNRCRDGELSTGRESNAADRGVRCCR